LGGPFLFWVRLDWLFFFYSLALFHVYVFCGDFLSFPKFARISACFASSLKARSQARCPAFLSIIYGLAIQPPHPSVYRLFAFLCSFLAFSGPHFFFLPLCFPSQPFFCAVIFLRPSQCAVDVLEEVIW